MKICIKFLNYACENVESEKKINQNFNLRFPNQMIYWIGRIYCAQYIALHSALNHLIDGLFVLQNSLKRIE